MPSDETKRVLKMLEDGKINAEEAARLIEAVALPDEMAGAADPAVKGKTLHIRVFKKGSDRPKVNVNIPLSIARWAMQFIPGDARARMQEKDIDADEIIQRLTTQPGEVITVDDEEEGQRVEIFIK